MLNQGVHLAKVENDGIGMFTACLNHFEKVGALRSVVSYAGSKREWSSTGPFNINQFDPVTTEEISDL